MNISLLFLCLLLVRVHSIMHPPDGIKERAIILVLGCHMNDILEDRITTAINYADTIKKPITWFLSGGTKNQIDRLSSNEAIKMEN